MESSPIGVVSGGLLILQVVDQLRCLAEGKLLKLLINIFSALGIQVDVPAFDDGQDCPALAGSRRCITPIVVSVVTVTVDPPAILAVATRLRIAQGMPKSLQATRYSQLPGFMREMRQKANLTQRELAKELGINHTMVHNSETSERRVDVAEFVDWATACGLDPVVAFKEFLKRRRG